MTTADPMVAVKHQIAAEHQLREKVVNEEFKIWKKTVPLLYNTIHTHSLKWPSMTVDFLPNYTVSDDKTSVTAQFVVGTNTSSREPDSVSILSLDLPSTVAPDFASFGVGDSIPIAPSPGSLKTVRSWKHPGEVNRAKASPSGSSFLTFDNAGAVHLFDVNNDTPTDFKFHASEGYSLEWISEQQFLSGANDSKVALWSVTSPSAPSKVFTSHAATINDLSFSKPSKNLFVSVADDRYTHIHDIRAPEESPAIQIAEQHAQNAAQFHPEISYLFATGGEDDVVNLYDARNTAEPIRKLYGHNDSVVGLRWNPHEPSQLHSWGLDRRVITWDTTYLTEEFSYPALEEGKRRAKQSEDPCLVFIHGGHTNRVNELAVHPKIPELFASVGDDSLLEIFQPKTVVEEENDDEEEEEKPENGNGDKMDLDKHEEKAGSSDEKDVEMSQ